jgi:uncharacterized DUF497 family protein
MLRIEALEVDDHILDKIESAHGVALDEVEGACHSPHRHIRRGRMGLYKLFSQTEAGRHLLVVLADQSAGIWRVVTAREMSDQERRLYRRAKGD